MPPAFPSIRVRQQPQHDLERDHEWVTIVWDDPVNLMSYVTMVFMRHFGYSRDKADQLMLAVHHEGERWSGAARGRRWRPTSSPCIAMGCAQR